MAGAAHAARLLLSVRTANLGGQNGYTTFTRAKFEQSPYWRENCAKLLGIGGANTISFCLAQEIEKDGYDALVEHLKQCTRSPPISAFNMVCIAFFRYSVSLFPFADPVEYDKLAIFCTILLLPSKRFVVFHRLNDFHVGIYLEESLLQHQKQRTA